MKLLTLNAHGIVEAFRWTKVHKLADYIVENDVDVICMQEVSQYKYDDIIKGNIKTSNQAILLQKILKELYGKKYYAEIELFKETWEIYDEGIAVLSKKPIRDYKSYYVSKATDWNDWHTRMAQEFKYDQILISNTHLNWDDEDESFLDNFNNLNLNSDVICGDFNIDINESDIKKVMGNNDYKDVVESGEATFFENTKIDYILFKDKLECINSKVEFKDKDNEISDHYLVFAQLKKK